MKKTLVSIIFIHALLSIPALADKKSLPDAVCGKGLHIGNPHCSSSIISPAPAGMIGSAPFGASIILSSALYSLWRKRK